VELWRKLFGRPRQTPKEDGLSPRVAEIIAKLKNGRQPCVRLVPGGTGGSRLGGVPDMAAAWPRYAGRPLCCVAQLDLEEVAAAGGPDWLPGQGRLLFFYELEYGAWGLDFKDRGSSVVIHETEPAGGATEPDDLSDDAKFPAYPVAFVQDMSFPTEERIAIDWKSMSATSSRALEQALEELAPSSPTHQIGGYPSPVQDDHMEGECVRLVGGIASEWRLLLQIDTDDDAGMMWGDVGSIYFWIRERDARLGDFSKIWMILQCN
jgi:uncharacterized protein YwqG